MNFVTWPYFLRAGHSNDPAQGACAMDAVNWLVHGEHGDAPACACPVITAYVIHGNDQMPDDVRQKLLPYLHRIAGSRSQPHEKARAHVLALGALRIFAPRALDTVGLHDYAAQLRSMPDDIKWEVAGRAAEAARRAAGAAGAAAAGAAGAAEAARRAAGAAWAAEAAWTAAAWAAAAWATAWAAGAAAEAAARAAAEAARAAAEAAAWDDYFLVLDQALNAGPQGEAWSADVIAAGAAHYRAAKGAEVLVS